MNWKNSKLWKWIIFLFLFLFGLFCYMKDYGYCSECSYNFHQSIPVEEEYLYKDYHSRVPWGIKPQASLSQKQEWQEAYDNHHFNAVRTYNDAYNRLWWLPNLTWRQIGRDCWVSACAVASTKTASTALVPSLPQKIAKH